MTKSAVIILRLEPELKKEFAKTIDTVNRYLMPSERLTYSSVLERYIKTVVKFKDWIFSDKRITKAAAKRRPLLSKAGYLLLYHSMFAEFLNSVVRERLEKKVKLDPEAYEEYKAVVKFLKK